MNKIVRKNLVLMFEAENGNKIEVTVLRPMTGLTGSAIKTAMDTVVATGALGAESPVAKITGAQYDIREIEEVELV